MDNQQIQDAIYDQLKRLSDNEPKILAVLGNIMPIVIKAAEQPEPAGIEAEDWEQELEERYKRIGGVYLGPMKKFIRNLLSSQDQKHQQEVEQLQSKIDGLKLHLSLYKPKGGK